MKYIRKILVWILILIFIGFIVKYIYDIPGYEFLELFIGIGLIIGFSRVILIHFGNSRKDEIFEEAKTIFNSRINLNGETEITIKGRKIILEYDLENNGKGASEFVIANVDMTDIGKKMISKCKDGFEILEKNNRLYAVIYSSWGYKGEKFTKRIENKLEYIDNCIKSKKTNY